jgi:hypothetical protein
MVGHPEVIHWAVLSENLHVDREIDLGAKVTPTIRYR